MRKFKIGDIVTYSQTGHHIIGMVIDVNIYNDCSIKIIRSNLGHIGTTSCSSKYLSFLHIPQYFNEL